jgi:hypothetical protein
LVRLGIAAPDALADSTVLDTYNDMYDSLRTAVGLSSILAGGYNIEKTAATKLAADQNPAAVPKPELTTKAVGTVLVSNIEKLQGTIDRQEHMLQAINSGIKTLMSMAEPQRVFSQHEGSPIAWMRDHLEKVSTVLFALGPQLHIRNTRFDALTDKARMSLQRIVEYLVSETGSADDLTNAYTRAKDLVDKRISEMDELKKKNDQIISTTKDKKQQEALQAEARKMEPIRLTLKKNQSDLAKLIKNPQMDQSQIASEGIDIPSIQKILAWYLIWILNHYNLQHISNLRHRI